MSLIMSLSTSTRPCPEAAAVSASDDIVAVFSDDERMYDVQLESELPTAVSVPRPQSFTWNPARHSPATLTLTRQSRLSSSISMAMGMAAAEAASPRLSLSFLHSDDLISSVASLLTEMCQRNDEVRRLCDAGGGAPHAHAPAHAQVTCFHSCAHPSISIADYLARLRRYANCSDACFVLAVIYLDLAYRRRGICVDSLNVHRLLVTSLTIAAKYFDDFFHRNSTYALIGGVGVAELNRLEAELLRSLDYELHVEPEDFHIYERALFCRTYGFPLTGTTTTTTTIATTATTTATIYS